MIVLDTHAALWLLNDDPALGTQSRSAIAAARTDSSLAVSAISFWETALLIAKGRLDLNMPAAELRRKFLDTGLVELPLTGDIAVLAVELDNLHNDPADRFIAATVIAHDATLMTADTRLLDWRHQMNRQDARK